MTSRALRVRIQDKSCTLVDECRGCQLWRGKVKLGSSAELDRSRFQNVVCAVPEQNTPVSETDVIRSVCPAQLC